MDADFHLLNSGDGFRDCGLVLGLVTQIKQDRGFFKDLFLLVERFDLGFEAGLLLKEALGLLLLFPKLGRPGKCLKFGYATLFARNVKDTPLAPPGACGGRRFARGWG